MSRKRSRTTNQILNNQTYLDYFNRLKNLYLNVFKWENLPLSVDERFLEMCLFEKGYCIYFNDEVLGNLALNCTIGGNLDVYGYPRQRRATAVNGYNKELDNTNSVLIYNNYLHRPANTTIELYALRLYEIERTIDVNVKGQKTPIVILANEQQRLTFKNLFRQYDGNEPFIYGDKNMDLSDIKTLDTGSPYVADKLQILKHQVWNEALTFCGIENSNQDKKERLVADEVGSNYGNIEADRNVMLNARKQAVEQINEMFETDIKVKYRSNLETMVNKENLDIDDIEFIEGEENE